MSSALGARQVEALTAVAAQTRRGDRRRSVLHGFLVNLRSGYSRLEEDDWGLAALIQPGLYIGRDRMLNDSPVFSKQVHRHVHGQRPGMEKTAQEHGWRVSLAGA